MPKFNTLNPKQWLAQPEMQQILQHKPRQYSNKLEELVQAVFSLFKDLELDTGNKNKFAHCMKEATLSMDKFYTIGINQGHQDGLREAAEAVKAIIARKNITPETREEESKKPAVSQSDHCGEQFLKERDPEYLSTYNHLRETILSAIPRRETAAGIAEESTTIESTTVEKSILTLPESFYGIGYQKGNEDELRGVAQSLEEKLLTGPNTQNLTTDEQAKAVSENLSLKRQREEETKEKSNPSQITSSMDNDLIVDIYGGDNDARKLQQFVSLGEINPLLIRSDLSVSSNNISQELNPAFSNPTFQPATDMDQVPLAFDALISDITTQNDIAEQALGEEGEKKLAAKTHNDTTSNPTENIILNQPNASMEGDSIARNDRSNPKDAISDLASSSSTNVDGQLSMEGKKPKREFLSSLHKMISDPETDDIIAWGDTGKYFTIFNKDKIVDTF